MASVAVIASGCVVRERTVVRPGPGPGPVVVSDEVVVAGPPPVEIVETQTISPGVGFVWIGGYHAWVGGRWVWTAGRWDRPPRAGVRWYAPRYDGRRHVWVRGYWR